MKLPSLATDNIAEILLKIVEFTHRRERILNENISNLHKPCYIPKDLEVEEFSKMMNEAILEHIQNRQLLFHDTENIRFGPYGSFEARPVVDDESRALLQIDTDEYLYRQTEKLLENSLNNRVATELLKKKQGIASTFS